MGAGARAADESEEAVRRFALASMLLGGCAHDNAVAFKLYDQRDEPSKRELEDACDVWGLDCYTITGEDDRGVVTLILSDALWDLEDGRQAEGIILRRGCSPVILAVGDSGAIAHELGHALGLQDSDDPDNVMADGSGPDVSGRQRARVQTHADWQALCVGGVDP